MNEVRCAMSSCLSVFRTEEPLAASVRYICSHHDLKSVFAAFPDIRTAHTKKNGKMKKQKDVDLHFQEEQFSKDPYMSHVTDPNWYLKNGGSFSKSSPHSDSKQGDDTAGQNRRSYIKKAEKELEGHEHKDEILAILKEDPRDRIGGGNSQ